MLHLKMLFDDTTCQMTCTFNQFINLISVTRQDFNGVNLSNPSACDWSILLQKKIVFLIGGSGTTINNVIRIQCVQLMMSLQRTESLSTHQTKISHMEAAD